MKAAWMAVILFSAVVWAAASAAHAQSADPTEPPFRAIDKELIEINTTRSVGNGTQAAAAMRARLAAAGYRAEDLLILAPPEAPNDGALIAVPRGQDRALKPILLLAHIDVVEAKREDWTRIPSSWSRKTAGSTRGARATTRPWPQS